MEPERNPTLTGLGSLKALLSLSLLTETSLVTQALLSEKRAWYPLHAHPPNYSMRTIYRCVSITMFLGKVVGPCACSGYQALFSICERELGDEATTETSCTTSGSPLKKQIDLKKFREVRSKARKVIREAKNA